MRKSPTGLSAFLACCALAHILADARPAIANQYTTGEDLWYQGMVLFLDGRNHERAGDWLHAVLLYEEAGTWFNEAAEQFPEYEPSMVAYRIKESARAAHLAATAYVRSEGPAKLLAESEELTAAAEKLLAQELFHDAYQFAAEAGKLLQFLQTSHESDEENGSSGDLGKRNAELLRTLKEAIFAQPGGENFLANVILFREDSPALPTPDLPSADVSEIGLSAALFPNSSDRFLPSPKSDG